jgi:hypothetical protein
VYSAVSGSRIAAAITKEGLFWEWEIWHPGKETLMSTGTKSSSVYVCEEST